MDGVVSQFVVCDVGVCSLFSKIRRVVILCKADVVFLGGDFFATIVFSPHHTSKLVCIRLIEIVEFFGFLCLNQKKFVSLQRLLTTGVLANPL